MKQSEIKLGKTYRGKNGKMREVIAFFGMAPGNVKKVLCCDVPHKEYQLGYYIRLSSFARWAKEEVEA